MIKKFFRREQLQKRYKSLVHITPRIAAWCRDNRRKCSITKAEQHNLDDWFVVTGEKLGKVPEYTPRYVGGMGMNKSGHGRLFVNADGDVMYEYEQGSDRSSTLREILLDLVRQTRNDAAPPWAIDAGCD